MNLITEPKYGTDQIYRCITNEYRGWDSWKKKADA